MDFKNQKSMVETYEIMACLNLTVSNSWSSVDLGCVSVREREREGRKLN